MNTHPLSSPGLLSKCIKEAIHFSVSIIPLPILNMKRAARIDPNSEAIKKLRDAEKDKHLEALQCGICAHVPRDPTDNECCASGGHFVCRKCISRWKNENSDCPFCREAWKGVKNYFRQEYLEYHYKCNLVGCSHLDCPREDLLANFEMEDHESFCVHRFCPSPAKNSYKMYKWHGSVANTGKHMAEHKCATLCLAVNPSQEGDSITFSKVLPNDKNYFFEDFDRCFKPILLLHRRLSKGLFWVQLDRNEDCFWMAYVMANLTQSALMKTRAEINISHNSRKFNGNVSVLSAIDHNRMTA